MAMAGTMTAVGGNTISLIQNPAGIAVFTKPSILTTSLSINREGGQFSQFATEYPGANIKLPLSSLAFVLTSQNTGTRFALAAGMHRLQSSQRTFQMRPQTKGVSASAIDGLFSKEATKDGLYSTQQLLLDVGVAQQDPNGGYQVASFYHIEGYRNFLREKRDESEWTLGWGVDFSQKVYFGMAFGFRSYFSHVEQSYREDSSQRYQSLGQEYLYSGNAVAFRIGFIVRVTKELRLGMAYHSSVTYNLLEDLTLSYLDQVVSKSKKLEQLSYKLRVPSQLLMGATYVFGNKGLLSAGIEMRFPQNSYYSDDQGALRSLNETVRDTYHSSVTYQLGGEYRINSHQFLRAGYRRTSNGGNRKRVQNRQEVFALGGGIALKYVLIDVGLDYTRGEDFIPVFEPPPNDFSSTQPYYKEWLESPVVVEDIRWDRLRVVFSLSWALSN